MTQKKTIQSTIKDPRFCRFFTSPFLVLDEVRKTVQSGSASSVFAVALERENGYVSRYDLPLPSKAADCPEVLRLCERIVKFLLWSSGGWKIMIAGPRKICAKIKDDYTLGGARDFDVKFMSKVYKKPLVVQIKSLSQLPQTYDTQATNPYIGKLVTLKGLKYGNQVFCLIYIDSNKEKRMSANRIFLSDQTWGVTTWAMSENKFKEYLDSGVWDSVQIGNAGDYTYGTVGAPKDPGFAMSKSDIRAHAAAYSVSQYFKMGGREIQLRTSGYSKFGDEEIPEAVLDGSATVDMTGILSLYQGSIQFTVNSLEDIVVHY